VSGFCERGDEPSYSYDSMTFDYQLSDWQILKDSALSS